MKPEEFLREAALARLEAQGINTADLSPPDTWMESEIMPCPECDANMEPTDQGDWTCEFCGLIY